MKEDKNISINQIVNYHSQNSIAKLVADNLKDKLVDVSDSLTDIADYTDEETPLEVQKALELIEKYVAKKSNSLQENLVKNREKIRELEKTI